MTKEEVLNGAANALNSPNRPWTVRVEGNSIIGTWKWMDATFFGMNEVTDADKEYTFIATLTDKGKWIEREIKKETTSNVDLRNKKMSFGASFSSGHTTTKSYNIGLGRNNSTGEVGVIVCKYDTSLMKNDIRNYLKNCGFKKKGLFF